MQDENKDNCKYVFVCGLQRSETSALARNIGRLENCTSFKNTGVLEDECQYLQDIYTHDTYSGTDSYGFDPRSDLTEASNLLTPANIGSLRAAWHRHWDPQMSICVAENARKPDHDEILASGFSQVIFCRNQSAIPWQ